MSRLFLFLRRSHNRFVTLTQIKKSSERRGAERRAAERRLEPRFSIGAPARERRQTERRAQ